MAILSAGFHNLSCLHLEDRYLRYIINLRSYNLLISVQYFDDLFYTKEELEQRTFF